MNVATRLRTAELLNTHTTTLRLRAGTDTPPPTGHTLLPPTALAAHTYYPARRCRRSLRPSHAVAHFHARTHARMLMPSGPARLLRPTLYHLCARQGGHYPPPVPTMPNPLFFPG